MPLSYDTQVELLFPPALFEDRVSAPILAGLGIGLEAKGNKVLLFTDSRTVAAFNATTDEVKDIFRNSGFGLVPYGWKKQERVDFLLGAFHKIAQQHASDEKALHYAVFDLMRFVHEGLLGRLHPNPFSPPPQAPPPQRFDIAEALRVLKSPEQMNKLKAPDHLKVARSFGRR
jgi:hypothetical protein